MDAAAIADITDAVAGQADEALWPQHVEVWNILMVAATQLRVVGSWSRPIVLGFDYAGVRVGLSYAGISVTPAQWEDFMVMEIEAVAELNRGDR